MEQPPVKSALFKPPRDEKVKKRVTLEMPEGAEPPDDDPTILGDIEEIKPEVVSPKPPSKPPSYIPMNPNAPSLQNEVDRLETGLARCVADFRAQAEEILTMHLAILEEVQVNHDHEMSNLVAENRFLREKLGIGDPDQVRNVMFQNMAEPKKKAGRGKAFKDEEDAPQKKQAQMPPPSSMTAWGKKGKNQPGGSWQAFMAWVPNAAAMQIAEPWKPLQQNEAPGKQRQVMKQKKEGAGGELSILPGVPDDKTKGEDEDSDSDSNRSGREDQYEMLEIWKASKKQAKAKGSMRGTISETESIVPPKEDEDEYVEPQSHGWILNPDSNIRISWDLGSLIMVLYDMVMIPMQAYTLPENLFLDFMEWTTRLFWTIDIFFSCITGVVMTDGSVEYEFKIILRRYAKTWLVMDLVIVLSDWSEVMFSSGGVAMLSFARTTRIIRIVRLLRLVRMQEIVANVTERIQSETLGPMLQVSKILVVLLAVSHFTGCLWFAIGARDTADSTWVDEKNYRAQGLDAQYLASLHWALSQFSGGMDEIYPASPLERLYAVAVGSFIFVLALVLLGVFTSGLTQQYIIRGSGERQLATLKRYLKQNNVSKVITKRVCRNAKHAISGDLTPDSVELLHVISEPLKIELSFDMYSQILREHPFFMELLQEYQHMMRSICHRAMSMLLLSSTDVIFTQGEEPQEPKMYFVVSGTLEYRDAYGEAVVVGEKRWLAEAVLWTVWKHRGTLTALTDAKLAMLDSQGFIDICHRWMRRSEAAGKIVGYAVQFMQELNRTEPDEINDLFR